MSATSEDTKVRATAAQLAALAPLSALSAERLQELSQIVVLERVARGGDPLAGRAQDKDSVFLLRGELLLAFAKGGSEVIVGGTPDASRALNRRNGKLTRTKAITEVEVLAVDDEVLDILATWDQVVASGDGESSVLARAARSDARLISGTFSLGRLRDGVFAPFPAAHIDELMKRFDRVAMQRGEIIIREGEEGEQYFVVESGRCQVERTVGGVRVVLAEVKSGDAFGEEALVSEAKRNATVVALSDGHLLRLGKSDFDELLREPLLRRAIYTEALERIKRGATWLDVRYPSEYQYDRLPGAINVPLSEVRNMFSVLDRGKDYVIYCQSGRRSAAAAFLFAQHGFSVWVLEGGLRAASRHENPVA